MFDYGKRPYSCVERVPERESSGDHSVSRIGETFVILILPLQTLELTILVGTNRRVLCTKCDRKFMTASGLQQTRLWEMDDRHGSYIGLGIWKLLDIDKS